MRIWRQPSLLIKFLAFLLLAVGINGVLLMRMGEEELEQTLLDQGKRQAQVFLLGVALELAELPPSPPPAQVEALLMRAVAVFHHGEVDFMPEKLYAYDRAGRVLGEVAQSREAARDHGVMMNAGPGMMNHGWFQPVPVADRVKDMAGYHGDVVRSGVPHLPAGVEYETDPRTGQARAVIDIIIPWRRDGEVAGGLEAQINLDQTVALIQRSDDHYEARFSRILAINGALLFVLFGLFVHHLLIRPIRRCQKVTQAIADGQLERRLEGPQGGDELGRLGGSINTMADSIQQLINEQEEAYLQAMQSLMRALESKDAYTHTHSSRVARYSVKLGERLGLDPEQLTLLRKGALMHDLGKIGIPDAILNKPQPLTDEEFAIMRQHPVATATITRPLKRFKAFTEIAAWHHERWDGKGYPDGLAGEAIPLLARIVSIADTWDAMTGDRVYRKGMPKEKALAIMEREQHDGQWDPHLIGEFVAMMRAEARAAG